MNMTISKYIIIQVAFFLNIAFISNAQNILYEQTGYLFIIRNKTYFIPKLNIKNIDTLNSLTVYSLTRIDDNILNNTIRGNLNKRAIVLLEETNPPNIRVIDTLYHGLVTLYYEKNKYLASKFARPETIQYSNLDSTRITFAVKDKYFANVFFILPKESAGDELRF